MSCNVVSLRSLFEKVPLSKDLKEIWSKQHGHFGKEPSSIGNSQCKGPKAGECVLDTARVSGWRSEAGEGGGTNRRSS